MANAWGTSQDPSQRLGGLMYGISPTDFSGQTDRLLQQGAYANQQAIASAGQAAQGAVGTAQSNWKNALAMTQGRGDAVMNDPYTKAALDRLNGVVNGSQVPYTQAVQNQLLARQADANSASTASQAGMLRDQMAAMGGSMADPQAQAAMRQLMAQQQQTNNANLGDMNTQATLQNFNAQQQAAMNLGAMRGSQLGMANSQYNQAGQMYANQQLAGPHQSGVSPVNYPTMGGNQGQGGNDQANQDAWNRYYQQLAQWQAAQRQGQQGQQPQRPAQVNTNMQVGGSGNWTGNTNGSTYQNGVNTATGVPMGTGYVQLHDQPDTRINYSGAASQYGVYNPQLPVY